MGAAAANEPAELSAGWRLVSAAGHARLSGKGTIGGTNWYGLQSAINFPGQGFPCYNTRPIRLESSHPETLFSLSPRFTDLPQILITSWRSSRP
jgi:hypothetical protein